MLCRQLKTIPRSLRYYSTVAEPVKQPKLDHFRTNESTTSSHSNQHIGRFYQIPLEDRKQIFLHGGLPKSFEKQVKTFGEACLMVREPAIEIMDYIKSSDLSRPVNRYVLHGEDGCGKSLTLAHVLHYGFQNEFLLVHVPWVPNWMKRPKETANSATFEGFIDLPFDAAAWLIHFKTQNGTLLPKLDLKTTKDYVWSKRETTPAGSTLSELIEHGITRVKFASDTISALLSEIKQYSTAGKCKVMVGIDGYNAFFHDKTRILAENKSKVSPDKVTLTKPFLDITNYDWTNGVCILAVDRIALTEERMDSSLPRYQLGKEGFEHCDPFIPIQVRNYSEEEYENCIAYYLDRKWIQNTTEGFANELKHLSSKNPYNLMNICAPL